MSAATFEAQADELDAALGLTARQAVIAGQPVIVRPLVVAQLPYFLRALRPIMGALQAGKVGAPAQLAWLLADEPDAVLDALAVALAQLPLNPGDKVALEVAIATRRDWLAGQQMDALLELLVSVVEVNADFFIQKMAPLMVTAQARMAGLESGLPPSPA
jgi:hypothetical protein